MRILFVAPYYPPEPGAGATRASELAVSWARQGHEVHVLTGMPCYPDGVVPPDYQGRLKVREERQGVVVHRGWVYAAANRGKVARAAWYLSQAASMAVIDAVDVPPVDVVVATSPHILAAAAGAFTAGRRGRPLVLDVRDLWPRSIWELGMLDRRGWPIRVLEALERRLYRQAAAVVVVSEAFVEPVRSVRGGDPDDVVVLTNGVDLARFAPDLDGGPVRERWGLDPGAPVALYAGTHGEAHGLDVVIAAARLAPEVQWVLVGDGSRKAELVRRGEGLTNLHFHPTVPAGEMAALYAACDVALVPLRDLPLFETVLPSKLFEIWGMGRPLVLGVRGEAARLVERSGAGVVVPPEDPAALAEAVRALAADPARRLAMGRAGRAFVEAGFDRDRLARRYVDRLERVVKAGAR